MKEEIKYLALDETSEYLNVPAEFTINFYNNNEQYKITIPSEELPKLARLLYNVLLDKGFTVKLDKIK